MPNYRLSALVVILALFSLSSFAQTMSNDAPSAGQGRVETVSDVKFPWRWIPGGTVVMGSPPDQLGRWADEPLGTATVQGFWIGQTEVTQKQFAAFVSATGYKTDAEKSGGSFIWTGTEWKSVKTDWRASGGDEYPAAHISWNDAVAFADWLSGELKAKVRLPSEAEWEWAARGGTSTATYEGNLTSIFCGKTSLADIAWFCGNSQWQGQPVGQKEANLWWLEDTLGNVWEWTTGTASLGAWVDAKQLLEPGTSDYVIRGGSWFTEARNCRASMRKAGPASASVSDVGFRVLMESTAKKAAH